MKIPTHLKHKPIYKIEDYSAVDGMYKNNPSVAGLSLGKAQWKDTPFVPSVKVWRRSKTRWSRQSEETTLTRALDMSTLIIKVLNKHYNEVPIQSIDTIYGSLEITENPEYIEELDKFLADEKTRKDLNAHIEMLSKALDEYKAKRK